MTMLPGQLHHSSPKRISSALPRLPCGTDLLLNPSGESFTLCLARALRQGIPVPPEFLLSVFLEGQQRVRPIHLLLQSFAKPRCPPERNSFRTHPHSLLKDLVHRMILDLRKHGLSKPRRSAHTIAYSGFIPNVMYRPGIAHDLVVWGGPCHPLTTAPIKHSAAVTSFRHPSARHSTIPLHQAGLRSSDTGNRVSR